MEWQKFVILPVPPLLWETTYPIPSDGSSQLLQQFKFVQVVEQITELMENLESDN